MSHLRGLGDSFLVPIRPDEEGFLGRECPNPDCEGYFKIEPGTGLKGQDLPCHCPYCGYTGAQNEFWTKAQIEYAKSIAIQKVTDAIYEDFKNLEFSHRPRGGFGIGLSLKVTRDRQTPIRHYREERLETEAVCANCTLRYSVYGVFAFCPDCGQHNSLQILEKNLEVVKKILDLAAGTNTELAETLIENALENCVSGFDGFGRELCRVHKDKAADPARAEKTSFQNLEGAKSAMSSLFGVYLAAGLTADEWQSVVRGFQKRHLFAHRMGVVDQDYVAKTGDAQAVIGRRVILRADEVRAIAQIISKLAHSLSSDLEEAGPCP